MHTNFNRVVNPSLQQHIRASEVLTGSDSIHHQWECLDLDVACLVLDKLLESIDRASFRVVCKEWGRLARAYRRLCKPKVLPMLLIPADNHHYYGKKNSRQSLETIMHQGLLYSVSKRRIYRRVQSIMLPSLGEPEPETRYSRYYRGCGHGWVAMIDTDVIFGSETIITLVNPFTTVILPSLPPLKRYNSGIPKVILSEDPTSNPDHYVVVAFADDYASMDFIKGRQGWYHIDCRPYLAEPDDYNFTDAIFYGGQIYMADSYYGIIAVFDYKSKQQVYLEKIYTPPPPAARDESERAYLVESINGDIFYIRRLTTSGYYSDLTKSFRVFKVVLNGSTVEHVEVKSIGDEALFVGDSHSLSFLASSSSGCQPNSIHFTDDSINFSKYLDNYIRRVITIKCYEDEDEDEYQVRADTGIFHLEDGTISRYYLKCFDDDLLPPAFWIIPPAF
ncbi:putative F-box protein At1g65770 [Rosa rugosa]|uniref:putative F-box protein At1g65770 n=1 Tax=Rosa rugosa TaxID=74645 RepID=UPI002B40C6FB|nr:putative F-box protein At1g65770 [Rosa rugosa]